MAEPFDLNRVREYLTHAHRNLSGQSCVDTQTLIRAVEGTLTKRDLHQVVNHCSLCSQCAGDWRVAKSLFDTLASQDSAPKLHTHGHFTPDPKLESPGAADAIEPNVVDLMSRIKRKVRSVSHRKFMPLIAACAGITAICIVQKPSGPKRSPGPRISRGGEPSVSQLSFEASEHRFAWHNADAGARDCELLIYDNALHKLARIPSRSDTVSLIGDQRMRLAELSSFYWQVRCKPIDGSWSYSKTKLQENKQRGSIQK